ncbi:hypothetical protein CVS40_12162 [Lucilia cuprina]|nr:hypothetical protein CVS40_12162 [Lucilia cuprina]
MPTYIDKVLQILSLKYPADAEGNTPTLSNQQCTSTQEVGNPNGVAVLMNSSCPKGEKSSSVIPR